MENNIILVAIVTLLLLIQYLYFAMQAGLARGKGNVKAPAITGDEDFERKLRVQANTLEQLVITLPAMWLCGYYFRADVAAVFGAVFLVARFVYGTAYVKEPASRGTGMIIGFVANLGLILCSLWGVIATLL